MKKVFSLVVLSLLLLGCLQQPAPSPTPSEEPPPPPPEGDDLQKALDALRELSDSSNENDLGGFCGASTFAYCSSSEECEPSGCSAQVCAGKQEQVQTTCEFTECYDKEAHNVSCECVSGKCQWTK